MKPIIIKTKYLKKFTGIRGIFVFPFIIYTPYKQNRYRIASALNANVERHERIHFAQALELWVMGFYVLYLYYYLKYRFEGANHKEAYYNIPFEKEAYRYQNAESYLLGRERNAWKEFTRAN